MPQQAYKTLSKGEIYALLHNRTKQWDFPTLSTLPHPYQLKSCEQASHFLAQKMREKPKILVVGDYDVDGVIASVVMMKFFALLGYEHISYVIPSRFSDGYGVSKAIIEANPSDIVITVDNGTTAYEAAAYCKQQGITLIITDHHIPKESLPEADFIINPQQKDCTFPQKEICGALVAWYFCAGLKIALGVNISLVPLLELVMLATIADMMPLTQINKCIVLYGLKQLPTSQNPALQKLKTYLKTRYITATDIAFSLTPLLNAAGRMGEGRIASEFLLLDSGNFSSALTQDDRAHRLKACSLASALDSGLQALIALNQARKDTAKSVLESAKACVIVYENAVIARGDDWHEGVLGIVAAQMANFYKRPAFVLSRTKEPGLESMLKGSARSFGEVDLMSMLLGANEILGEFGGHSKAAGLSVEIASFDELCAYLDSLSVLPKCQTTQEELGALLIDVSDINEELFALLQEFEPYGQGNPKPILQARLQIRQIQSIKQHRKFSFFGTDIGGIYFFCEQKFEARDWILASFTMQMDSYSGKPIMVLQEAERIG
ncbi:single-stranded-DNA-specific exonuclease RecJ [Helicobacter sp.]|uniref:single-stranded-DNA-specific exonuclease RecJ n=1 Tax=Helicobacter sp. TaxID=218 RepID=UPI0025C37537|nr:single-stranded-DNA-specific exonuclease RecJ [Helicobacter sp.]MBR2494544.1 single-stranded-DNA-specific exonuclease RecJ [Helicobacter sp.]